jgi:hypothetical protein
MKGSCRVFAVIFVFLASVLISACSTAGPSVPPAAATTPTSASQTQIQTTATSGASPTTRATSTTTAAASASSATRTSAPSASAATPIIVATPATNEDASGNAAKVYVSAIRVSPTQPAAGRDYVTFYVTFVNNSGQSQALKWYVKIWSPDNANQSFGETAKQINDIPSGTSLIASAANWRTNPIGCQPFIARVYWLNSSTNFGNPVEFTKPDGSPGVQQNFQVCEPTKTP